MPVAESARRPVSAVPWLLLGYVLFLVYGSLVPLDFHPYDLAKAWADFQKIPFLHLGVESRADWVANGVLYAPLGFWAVRSLLLLGLSRPLACLLALPLCLALAVGVEFTQLFFPPRTVSQNDILAEGIGSVVGALLACSTGAWLTRLAGSWSSGGALLGRRLLELYGAVYTALCFFPYDLLLSADELRDKSTSANWGWLLAPQPNGMALAALQLLVEVTLALPLGAWLALRSGARRAPLMPVVVLGLLYGVVVEVGQFFIASGVSQGASVATRAMGFALGAWLLPHLLAGGLAGLRRALARVALPLWLPYLALLLAVNGLFTHALQTRAGMAEAWSGLRLMPFYYHYYTTEAIALFSLASVSLMVLPAAALGWARGWTLRAVMPLVLVLVGLLESAKLLFVGLRPDPTNLVIAAATAFVALSLLDMLQRSAAVTPPGVPATAVAMASGPHMLSPWLLALPLVAVQALLFPLWPLQLLLLLGAATAAVWRWPRLALGLLPAALPLLDLAPWSGRLYWDAYDLLCLCCLAVALHRSRGAVLAPGRRSVVDLALAVLAVSLALSTVVALVAQPQAVLDGVHNLHSPLNALRIVKGAVWAALFLWLWRRLSADAALSARWFGSGVVCGLAGCVAAVLWERAAFAGLWDGASDFRISGLFSTMRTGGAFIECWLAVAAAFTLQQALTARRWPLRVLALLLLAGAAYAMAVTYSRNGYAALALVLLLTLVLQLRAGLRRWPQAAWAGAVLVLTVAVALPLALGPFALARLATVGQDFNVRAAHWQDGLRLRDAGPVTALLGMGVGSYPALHYWRSQEPVRAASYSLRDDSDGPLLRLGTGATVYLDQIVGAEAAGALQLTATLRPSPGGTGAPATLQVALCEKWILTSQRCRGAVLKTTAAAWQPATVSIEAGAPPSGNGVLHPPLTLSLLTPKDAAIDVRDLHLTTAAGAELLHNGDFTHGLDRWSFSTDVDPPWQLHNLPLTVLFDQGWFGVLAWAAVLLGALAGGARLAWQGRALVPAAWPALCAFLLSGSLNTLIDAPRFLWLLLVLAWLSVQATGRTFTEKATGPGGGAASAAD